MIHKIPSNFSSLNDAAKMFNHEMIAFFNGDRSKPMVDVGLLRLVVLVESAVGGFS